jgi:hypothetical protein
LHLFLSHSIHTASIPDLLGPWGPLGQAGIVPRKGRIELYPTESNAIRVPFGRIPGQDQDRLAWLHWVEAFQAGYLVRHDLSGKLQSFMSSGPPGPTKRSVRVQGSGSRPVTQLPTHTTPPSRAELRGSPGLVPPEYDRILGREPRSKADADYLWHHGILRPNTRHQVLLWLSQHLVWHLNVREDQAIIELTAWALDHRHNSQTIQSDLRDGTDHTRMDIESIVRWCVTHQRPRPSSTRGSARKRLLFTAPRFTTSELAAIKPHVDHTLPEHRPRLAHFGLCMLDAARSAGQPAPTIDGRLGYLVHVAAKVMRSWPAQAHMAYKQSLDCSVSTGLLALAKEKYQPKHGKGRARQWFLAVPYDTTTPTYDYDQAHALLTDTTTPEAESTPSDTGVLAVAPTSPTTRSIPVCGVHPDEHTDCQRPAGERSALSFDQRQVCPAHDVDPG